MKTVFPPALVLAGSPHGNLGIVRTLGRLGLPVYIVETRNGSPASQSRYCAGSFVWDFTATDEAETVGFLMDCGKSLGSGCLLFPTCDDDAILAASHYGTLSKWFAFPAQSPELVRSLVSKKEMYFLARKHGIPVPQASFPQNMEEAISFSETATFPVVAKGIDGARLKRALGAGVIIADHQEDLFGIYRQLEKADHSNVMLQEFIPGGDERVWMFNGYFDHNSDCRFGVTGKKIRQYPAYTGATSLGICAPNPTVERTTIRWMKELGYKGILDIGYRYDERDGKYKVLDVNPRIGATFRLFVDRGGLDVARVLYLDLAGKPVRTSPVHNHRKWIVEDADVGSSLRYHRDGKLTFSQWLRSLAGIQEAAYFARDDMGPFRSICTRTLRKKIQNKSLGILQKKRVSVKRAKALVERV